MVEREGFRVPLIGIPPEAVLQECDCCHDSFPMLRMELRGGQMLCEKCRKP
jgi:formylmethanofuran dehydrogenase subunit E